MARVCEAQQTSVVFMTLRFVLIYCKCIIGGYTCGCTGVKTAAPSDFNEMATPGTSGKVRPLDMLHADDERWKLVLRIASSAQFRRAPRLREFLLYVCDKGIAGETDHLNEQHIGQAVFDRGKDYSPAEDNVVRAHARQLRTKLGEYFAESGKLEPLLLEIPKGSYAPLFSKRSESTVVLQPALPAVVEPRERVPRRSQFALAAIAVVALALCGYLWFKNRELRKAVEPSTPGAAELLAPPLSWMFDEHLPTTVIVADSSFGLRQDVEERNESLEEYLKPGVLSADLEKPLSKDARTLLQRLETRQFTSFADLVLSQRILRLAARFQDKVSVRSARDVRMRDLASGNFIFLGSSYSNPWVSLFAKRRNFSVSLEAASRRGIVTNKSPRPNESAVYVMEGEDGLPGPTYGVITFLPADAETGNVLIIEGINMEGTEAAGRYLTNARELDALRGALDLRDARGARLPLEVLLETRVMGGATRDTRIVATRKGKGP